MHEDCCAWCNQEVDADTDVVLVAVYDIIGNIIGSEPVCWDCWLCWYW